MLLVDWPVYPRLRGTMQTSTRSRNNRGVLPEALDVCLHPFGKIGGALTGSAGVRQRRRRLSEPPAADLCDGPQPV